MIARRWIFPGLPTTCAVLSPSLTTGVDAINTPRMRLKRLLSYLPRIANRLSQHDQLVLHDALQQELSYTRATPTALNNFEQHFFSQNGEDGIIQEIFRRIGVTDRYFVEFGIETGLESCCRYLLEQHDWHGLWIEADDESVQIARSRFASLPVQILSKFLSRENILQIFAEAGVPAQFDLLVIDVDGNDYWLWQTISTCYSPRLLVLEYNPAYTPAETWVMPYNPEYRGQTTGYSGASLKAMTRLARKRGYELVACDLSGVNAFFVRRDLLHDQFTDVGSVKVLHRTFKHNPWWYGLAPAPHVSLPDFNMKPVEPSDIDQLRVTWAHPLDRLQVKVGCVCYLSVELDNGSATVLVSLPPYPVSLGYHWIKADQSLIPGPRSPLIPISQPSTHNRYEVRINAPTEPGLYTLRVGLVQEYLRWFVELNENCSVSVSLEVVP